MLKQISWASYWSAIGIVLSVYYVVVCFKFYTAELKAVLAKRSIPLREEKEYSIETVQRVDIADQSNASNDCKEQDESNITRANPNEDLFPIFNHLSQQIKMTAEDAARKNKVKPEIIYTFQLTLKQFPLIKNSPFEVIVNNYIESVCSNYCSIHLDEAELKSLWEL